MEEYMKSLVPKADLDINTYRVYIIQDVNLCLKGSFNKVKAKFDHTRFGMKNYMKTLGKYYGLIGNMLKKLKTENSIKSSIPLKKY